MMTNMNKQSLVEWAKDFAKEKHTGQKRRNGDDYFEAHVEKVVAITRELIPEYFWNPLEEMMGIDYEALELATAAAYLHDVVEDCNVSIDEIKTKSENNNLGIIVDLLTRKPDQTYFDFIIRIVTSDYGWLSDIAMIIKIADLRSNIADATSKDKMGSQFAKYQFAEDLLIKALL